MRKSIVLTFLVLMALFLFGCSNNGEEIISVDINIEDVTGYFVKADAALEMSVVRSDGEAFPENTTFSWAVTGGQLSTNDTQGVTWTLPAELNKHYEATVIVEQAGQEPLGANVAVGTVSETTDIFTNFSMDPELTGWLIQDNNTAEFNWQSAGYLEVSTKRDGMSSRIYHQLPRTITYEDDFWFEVDVETNNELHWLFAGVTDSSTGNHRSFIGVIATRSGGARLDAAFYSDDGDRLDANGGGIGDGTFNHRLLVNYTHNDSEDIGVVNVQVVDLSTNEVVSNATRTEEEISTKLSEEMDVFFIGNRTDGSAEGLNGPVKFDNVYFSLTGPNQNRLDPSF